MMLCAVLITLVFYKSLQVNPLDCKRDLNSCFIMKLPVYDLEMLWPNCHTFRCRFITMHIHRVVVHCANSVYIIEGLRMLVNKVNIVFHANSIALFYVVALSA